VSRQKEQIFCLCIDNIERFLEIVFAFLLLAQKKGERKERRRKPAARSFAS